MDVFGSAQILRINDQKVVQASIIKLTYDIAQTNIDHTWWNDPSLLPDFPEQLDSHWKWSKLAYLYAGKTLKSCIAIISQEQYIEGAIAYEFGAQSKIEPGTSTVYIGRLATAPRNRQMVAKQPCYRGIGSSLLYCAVKDSYKYGLRGRISLQSLPNPDTLAFYEKKGFVRTDLSQPLSTLIDYELPEAAALAWLKKEGDLS